MGNRRFGRTILASERHNQAISGAYCVAMAYRGWGKSCKDKFAGGWSSARNVG